MPRKPTIGNPNIIHGTKTLRSKSRVLPIAFATQLQVGDLPSRTLSPTVDSRLHPALFRFDVGNYKYTTGLAGLTRANRSDTFVSSFLHAESCATKFYSSRPIDKLPDPSIELSALRVVRPRFLRAGVGARLQFLYLTAKRLLDFLPAGRDVFLGIQGKKRSHFSRLRNATYQTPLRWNMYCQVGVFDGDHGQCTGPVFGIQTGLFVLDRLCTIEQLPTTHTAPLTLDVTVEATLRGPYIETLASTEVAHRVSTAWGEPYVQQYIEAVRHGILLSICQHTFPAPTDFLETALVATESVFQTSMLARHLELNRAALVLSSRNRARIAMDKVYRGGETVVPGLSICKDTTDLSLGAQDTVGMRGVEVVLHDWHPEPDNIYTQAAAELSGVLSQYFESSPLRGLAYDCGERLRHIFHLTKVTADTGIYRGNDGCEKRKFAATAVYPAASLPEMVISDDSQPGDDDTWTEVGDSVTAGSVGFSKDESGAFSSHSRQPRTGNGSVTEVLEVAATLPAAQALFSSTEWIGRPSLDSKSRLSEIYHNEEINAPAADPGGSEALRRRQGTGNIGKSGHEEHGVESTFRGSPIIDEQDTDCGPANTIDQVMPTVGDWPESGADQDDDAFVSEGPTEVSTHTINVQIRQYSPSMPSNTLPPSAKRRGVVIALGSNLGDRIGEIEKACRAIDEDPDMRIIDTSCLYESEPMYVEDQARFINGVCEIETTLSPMDLLDRLQAIEQRQGRVKLIDKGARNIDLDIILYGQEVVKSERLTVPHALMQERAFVLRPLVDLHDIDSVPVFRTLPNSREPVSSMLGRDPVRRDASKMNTVTPIRANMANITRSMDDRRTYIMSILNTTPDSFSDGGTHNVTDLDGLRRTAAAHIAAGATIIDVGGQSSRPNAPDVTGDEEIRRVLPAIEAIRSLPEGNNVAISVDTYRAAVAEAAVKAGADIVNDISAGMLDPLMLKTVARLGCTYIMMHMRGTPETMTSAENCSYPRGIFLEVTEELNRRLDAALDAGIRRWRIIVDPGIGFAKTHEQNVALLREMGKRIQGQLLVPGGKKTRCFGSRLSRLPMLIGTSRKGFIGKITGVTEPKDRIFGTAATVTMAVAAGADIVRVHDVAEMTQVVKMADAMYRVADAAANDMISETGADGGSSVQRKRSSPYARKVKHGGRQRPVRKVER